MSLLQESHSISKFLLIYKNVSVELPLSVGSKFYPVSKEIEESNRMVKTRYLFMKIIDTKGNFHAMMGIIKDRDRKDLTQRKEIKKRWQEYTEELYDKGLNDQDNHDGAVSHLESDILESKVKGALGSITTNKASGGDEIPAELLQILKDGAVKVLRSIHQQIWKTLKWPQDWKRPVSFHSNLKERQC